MSKYGARIILALALLCFSISGLARSIICESIERGTQHCPADTRGGVSLSVQYSKASCRQGSTWGYDNRGIWVSNGCRAQFDLGSYQSSHGRDHHSDAAAALVIGLIGAAAISAAHDKEHRGDRGYDYHPDRHDYDHSAAEMLTCESIENGRNYCRANLRHARVDIQRQLSRTECRYGRNWGWDSRGIWVDGGCRAVFSIE
ncbi:MAG: DUF3011 domain-containing protein [Xanthomonadales bacterium]|nr:DUF3011 domain-containing protein [Xanthomonadales bacterium]